MLMTLVRLVYASHFKHNDYFLQCLEGGREAVSHLYSKICQDPRHENVTLLRFEEISERRFEDWSMKLVMLTEKNNRLINRFATVSKFNPLRMNG